MAITGPIALYANLPIEPQFYQPWRFVITAITLGQTTETPVTSTSSVLPVGFRLSTTTRNGGVISVP